MRLRNIAGTGDESVEVYMQQFQGCVLGLLKQAEKAYYKLRLERTNAKMVGVRAKRAAEAAAEEKDKAK